MLKSRIKKVSLTALAVLALSASTCFSAVYKTTDENAKCYSDTGHVIDLNADKTERVSVQLVYTTAATASAINFTDGRQSTAAITVSSATMLSSAPAVCTLQVLVTTALIPTGAYSFLTVSSNPCKTETLGSSSFSISGVWFVNGIDWSSGTTSALTATNIAASINASTLPLTATATGFNIVKIVADEYGQATNGSYSIVSATPAALTIAYPTLSFGWDKRAQLILNGQRLKAGIDFGVDIASDGITATRIASSLNFSTYGVAVTANGTKVTFTALKYGTIGNYFTLLSSTQSALATDVSTTTGYFRDGRNPAILKINQFAFENGKDWTATQVQFSSYAAKALSEALMANNGLKQIVISTWIPAAYAYNRLYITSMTGVIGSTVSFYGTNYPEGGGHKWRVLGTSHATMVALSTALASSGLIIATAPSITDDYIDMWSTTLGQTPNNYWLSFNPAASSFTVLNASFTGGSYAVVYVTSTQINKNEYIVTTSTQAALTLQGSTNSYTAAGSYPYSAWKYFENGLASDINTSSGIVKSNLFTTGMAVLLTSSTGRVQPPLTVNTTYFVIKTPVAEVFKLATTPSNAVAGTNVAFTPVTLSTGEGNFILTPLLYGANANLSTTGLSSATWQVSNDSANWTNATTPISMNVTGSTSADLGNVNYRWLRLNVVSSSNTPTNVKSYYTGRP